MKKGKSFAILTIAGAAVFSLTSCFGEKDPEKEQEHTHTFSELHAQVDPTCLSQGQEAYYTCEGCDLIFNESKEVISQIKTIPAKAHIPHHHKGSASCESGGTGEYWTCDNEEDTKLYADEDCSDVISAVPVVGPLGHHLVHQNGQAATCKTAGFKDYYKCDREGCGDLFEDEEATKPIADLEAWKDGDGKIAIGEHNYGTPQVVWSGNSAHAVAKCTSCTATIEETKVGTFVEDTAATCLSAQTGHYEVTFNDTRLGSARTEANTAEGAAATGEHTYGTAEVSWSGSSATATATCTATGCDSTITETKEGTFVEDTAATCHSAQTGHYEVTFNDTRLGSARTEANSATGDAATGNHTFDYANKVVTWKGDTATATVACSTTGCTETVSEEKQGTYVKDSDATCTAPEKGHYEVEFNNTNFGTASTGVNSIENGAPHAHLFGELTPRVEAVRENDGNIAYYQCSECNGYFDSDKNPVNESSLVIPAPARSFSANTNFDWDFNTPIEAGSTITMDLKFVDGDANSKIAVQLFGANDDGSCDWDNCFGSFSIFSDKISDNPAGVSLMKCDDGYVRVTFVLDSITKKSGTPNGVAKIFFDGRYTNVGGYVEVNSNVDAHTKGAELIPAKAAGPHGGADGYQAHYECTGCDDYWFNESGAVCKKEDLTIASAAVKYAPPAEGKTMAEFRNLGNLSDKFWIDIHFDNPTKHQELGFNFYESAWDNYYGIFWVDCDENGVYFEGDYNGLELVELEDGWWRLNVYPVALNRFVKDKDIDQKRSIDFIYVQGPNTVSNRGSGMMEFMSDYDKVLPSTKVYSLSGKDSYTTERIFSRGDKINLDIQIKNNSQANIVLMQNWSTVVKFNVTAAGTILDQTNGVQIFKLNNEAEGYPTLDGTWYRIIIDLAYAKIESGMEGYTYIDRIGGNNWNAANFDMMIGSPYTTDGWYTIAGGASNNKINFKIPTPLTIRDGDGQLLDKALYFEVKAVGTGKAYVSPMDYDWHNCGKYVLTFTDGALTDRVVQGSANKWPKVTDLGNGVYGLTLALSQLPGDGLASASSIGFFYNGDGVLANGLSEFSINVLSLKLVEIPA